MRFIIVFILLFALSFNANAVDIFQSVDKFSGEVLEKEVRLSTRSSRPVWDQEVLYVTYDCRKKKFDVRIHDGGKHSGYYTQIRKYRYNGQVYTPRETFTGNLKKKDLILFVEHLVSLKKYDELLVETRGGLEQFTYQVTEDLTDAFNCY